MGSGVTECGWRHAPQEHRGFWENLKKVNRVEICLGRRQLAFASSRGLVAGAVRDWRRGDEKARIERMCISHPYVEEPLNSKVINSFVPELRRRVFRVSRSLSSMYICYIYIYIYIYMIIICPFHTYPYLAMVYRDRDSERKRERERLSTKLCIVSANIF